MAGGLFLSLIPRGVRARVTLSQEQSQRHHVEVEQRRDLLALGGEQRRLTRRGQGAAPRSFVRFIFPTVSPRSNRKSRVLRESLAYLFGAAPRNPTE